MKIKMSVVFFIVILIASSGSSLAYDYSLGNHVGFKMKGELVYAAKLRMEDPDPELKTGSSGNYNFEKYDIVNDKGTVRLTFEGMTNYFTLYARGEAFYDAVFNDKDVFNEVTREYANARVDLMEGYLEGNFSSFTFRLGKQIVTWGESVFPQCMVINCLNLMSLDKIYSAGYSSQDYQVPSLMAWVTYEPTPTIAVDAIYSPEFDPMTSYPVVGTWGSFMDIIGYGSEDAEILGAKVSDMISLDVPESSDAQEYGFSVRKVFPNFNEFELGLYYFHHYDRYGTFSVPETLVPISVTWEEVDMYGLSFSQAIDAFDLFLQVGGEFAYRPNDILQKNWKPGSDILPLFNASFDTSYAEGDVVSIGGLSPGGFERGGTLSWALSGGRAFSNVLPFTPWTFSLSSIGELSGEYIMDYDADIHSDPQSTCFYLLQLPFTTSDMIDNFKLEYLLQAQGNLHNEKISSHTFTFQVKAKYGNSLEGLVAYALRIGDPEENNITDRNDLTFKVTYSFQ